MNKTKIQQAVEAIDALKMSPEEIRTLVTVIKQLHDAWACSSNPPTKR